MKEIYKFSVKTIRCLIIFSAFGWMTRVESTGKLLPFVTPGLPACYVSETPHEFVAGAATLCSHLNALSNCGLNGNSYYFFCGVDHECCYHDGCPACCTRQEDLSKSEVAGIVIACTLFFAIILVIVYLLAGKFCNKGAKH